jgi:hypothetical protein
MDNLRLTVFDIFSYMIPGLCYLVLLSWLVGKVDLSEVRKTISELSVFSALAYSFLSYLLGFVSDAISSLTILPLTDKIVGDLRGRVLREFRRENRCPEQEEYHFSTVYSFVDAKAPHVREKADQFSAMSGMARNLSLVFLIYGLSVAWSGIRSPGTIGWSLTLRMSFAMVISFLLVRRADMFRRWSHTHLLNVYVLLADQLEKTEMEEPKRTS